MIALQVFKFLLTVAVSFGICFAIACVVTYWFDRKK